MKIPFQKHVIVKAIIMVALTLTIQYVQKTEVYKIQNNNK